MQLNYTHLMTLNLDVEPMAAHQIGTTQLGRRVIVPITGGRFEGENLEGTVEPGGYDWATFQSSGGMNIDVRLVLRFANDDLVYMRYQGRLLASADVHKRMATGEQVNNDEFSLTTTVKFETGAESLKWLNDVIAVGVGRQSGYQPTYEIFKVGN